MNTNEKQAVIARIARRSLVSVCLLVAALCFADPGRAQSNTGLAASPAARPADAMTSQAQAPPAPLQSQGTAPAAKPADPSEKNPSSPAKGQHEGISVHGYWLIDVKDPDGKVITHREFENAIQQYGIDYLSALLAGNNSPGGLSITLNGANMVFPTSSGSGSTASISLSFSDPGPCLPVNVPFGGSGGPSSGSTCLLTSGTSYLGGVCFTLQQISASNSSTSPCSTNLSTSAFAFTAKGPTFSGPASPPTSTSSAVLVLSGSVTATSLNQGTINDVETIFTACDTNSTPTSCLNYFNPQTQATSAATPVELNLFTAKLLDGKNGDPAPVPYIPGQTIFVTVQFTFQ